MAAFRATLIARSLAAAALCAGLSAQIRPRNLELIHCFALEQIVTPEFEEPHGWLDADHYLSMGVAKVDGLDVPVWFKNPAAGGAKAVHLPPTWFTALMKQPGMIAADVLEATADADAFQWNDDHSAFVLNFANDLFWITADSAERLTRDPAEEVGEQIAPDGSMVAYVKDKNVWVAAVGGTPRPLTDGGYDDLFFGRLDWVYQEELYGRGNFQGYWWSPDSTRVALLRLDEEPVKEFTLVSDTPTRPKVEVENYPKAGEPNPVVTLGIVDVAGGEPRWFDMSRYGTAETLIVRVTWHPSGEEVFFQVQDREQTWMEMLAGNAKDGSLRLVFREESPCWIEAGPEPMWLKDGAEFLWLSERDGFKHIYRYSREGKLLGRHTEGRYEVDEIVDVDEEAGVLHFVSDRGDWKQQNLFSLSLANDAEPVRVTERDGWHDVDFAPDHKKFLDDYSRIDHPKTVRVKGVDGQTLHTLVESRDRVMAAFGAFRPEFVKVPTRDGFQMEGMVIKPNGFDPAKKYPCLQFTYSGPHAPRVLDRWRFRDFLWHTRLAQKGYVVFVVDNRSASGQGRESACACYRKFGQTELQDLEDGLDWLLGQGYVDPSRTAIWGWSYGGYQTLYNLTHSKKWAAGVAVNPVTDWKFYDTIYTERYMGLPQTNVEGYEQGSVLNAAAQLHGKLLLVHATMDDNVHMQNSFQFAWALQQAGKQFEFMPYPRVRHGINDFAQQMHLFTAMEAFLQKTIGGDGE